MLSIVIPIHNEEHSILPLYDRLTAVLEPLERPYEIIFVDDASFDRSFGQALTLVQKTINPWALEEVLVSPTGLATFIIGSSIWGFIWSTAVVAIFLSSSRSVRLRHSFEYQRCWSIDSARVRHRHIPGFSMIGSGILILTKQGDPITALITIATSLFGNVLFPPSVLPPLLQVIAYVTAPYYFFTCIKDMFIGFTIPMILPKLLILALMCAIIMPVGYAVYAWCSEQRRINYSWF